MVFTSRRKDAQMCCPIHPSSFEAISHRSSLAQALRVEFLRVKENKPSEENILKNNHATLELEDSETLGPYCLVIHNTTEYDLWPYVFTFDAAGLTICEFHMPFICHYGE
jgi:hypothetical protein